MAATGITPEEVWTRLQSNGWGVTALREAKGAITSLSCKEESWRETDWVELVTSRREQLATYAANVQGERPAAALVVLVADTDPVVFLAGFWAGILAGWTVAFANPNWSDREWQVAYRRVLPDIIWGDSPFLCDRSTGKADFHSPAPSHPNDSTPAILIPTGGTSGQLKFAHHTWATLTAAVTGFQSHFQPDTPVNTYCVLPLYHVSGLMQALRTWLTSGKILIAPFNNLISSPPISPPPYTYLSLVPTQLSRLIIAGKSTWLKQFHAVFLGGAPPWPALLDQATKSQIPICLSYGMTETGAMVTAMRSQDSALGNFSSGQPLPHAAVRIEDKGKPLPSNEIGQVVVTSRAIAHGYYNAPSANFEGQIYTDDLGYLDGCGQLHITGRASSKIISGGENIFPEEVEAALRSTGQVLAVCAVGMPDADWGESVAAAYVPAHSDVSADSLRKALDSGGQLSRYKYPKQWFALDELPENAQGKVNRLALQALLSRLSSQSGARQ